MQGSSIKNETECNTRRFSAFFFVKHESKAINTCAILATINFAFIGSSVIPASASPLSAQDLIQQSAACAPSASSHVLLAVARTESGLDPWALHDNTTNVSDHPASFGLAVTEATDWVKRGDSVDIGLMQINSANLPALNMSIESALDPCASLAGGDAVLHSAFNDQAAGTDEQVDLLLALSRYNTGSPFRGIMNGYARSVIEKVGEDPNGAPLGPESSTDLASLGSDAPPSWDISSTGIYVETHAAPWLVSLGPKKESQSPSAEEQSTPHSVPAS